jgi:type IV pilus assembly protein PilC
MKFRCRLGTPSGEVIEAVYVAETEARLRRELEDKGLYVLALQPRSHLPGWLDSLPFRRRRRIPQHDFLVFNEELATLLKAGMPLVQSLDLLRHQVTNSVFKGVLDDVYERVKAGEALSDAFAQHSETFSGVYIASLLAGEKSGSLDTVIRRFVAYQKVIGAVWRKTVSALVYPLILITLSLILVAIIVLRVVPAFSDFYASFNAELPLVTRIIVQISNAVRSQFLLLFAVLAALVGGLAFWMKQPGQRLRIDRWVFATPVVGSAVQVFCTAQLARTLSTLLGGGIPLVNALEVAARSIGNRYMAQELGHVVQRVREGGAFAGALEARRITPDVAVKMIEVGETTGSLQEMLGSLADFYDEEIDTRVSRFVTVIEPLLLVVMGIVIAGLVVALYMPLLQLTAAVS